MAHRMEHLSYPKIWDGGRKTLFSFLGQAVWHVGT